MPRPVNLTPLYCQHLASGHAVVRLNGRDVYLGPYGSDVSRAEYGCVVGQWLARGRQPLSGDTDRTIAELILAFWDHAQTYYRSASGHTGEIGSFRLALRELRLMFGETPVVEFGPLALKTLREQFVKLGWSRNYANRQTGRIKQVFRWGTENELVSGGVYQTLVTVSGLRRGKTEARETEPIKPVPEEYVNATIATTSPPVAAMIRLQMLTGMRPGEVVIMRGCDIDTSGKLWVYRPAHHKTEHHGYSRAVYLGEKCKKIVQPFLQPNLQAYLFSPAEADVWRRGKLAEARKTPMSCATWRDRTGCACQVASRASGTRRPATGAQSNTPAGNIRGIRTSCVTTSSPSPARTMGWKPPRCCLDIAR